MASKGNSSTYQDHQFTGRLNQIVIQPLEEGKKGKYAYSLFQIILPERYICDTLGRVELCENIIFPCLR